MLGDASEPLGARLDAETVPVFVDPIRGWRDAPPIPARVEVGDAVHELCELGSRMIAVGSRGMGPARRALLGSVSAALPATAPCPVLVAAASGALTGVRG